MSEEGGGGGNGGRQNLTKTYGAPLSVIKIEQYCGARGWGGGSVLGTLKSYKDNGAPSPSLRLISIVGSGKVRGGIAGVKILQKIMAPPLSVIKIVKYCGIGGGGH